MVAQEVINEIDRVIKACWKEDIPRDYMEEYLLREDSLKCALYYHLRQKLDTLLRENSLRIYAEYYMKELKYRADLAIVHIDENLDYSWLGEAVVEVVAIFELKYTGGEDEATLRWIKNDLWKFKDYMRVPGLKNCQFYFATIFETECRSLAWLDARSTNNWAKGRVTELDSGIMRDEMIFEVHSYNNLNEEMNDEGAVI